MKFENQLLNFAKKTSKIYRSITGKGVRDILQLIKKDLPNLKIKSVHSGFKAFDWTVPNEWHVDDAYISNNKGEKIIDFKKNNLHLVSYSVPIDKTLSLKDLNKNLFSIKKSPTAIPYVTSYYKKTWGFCLSHNQRKKLKNKFYKVKIKSKFFKGILNYGEIYIPGKSKKEIFLSTYICHPVMANNESSGPTISKFLAEWIQSKKRFYSYRIIFIPETIGSIVYLKKNLKKMKQNIIAGFNINCVGDNRIYSYLPSRNGDTLPDKIAKHVLNWNNEKFIEYSWNERGSDERQYCSPGVNLPVVSIMRSKYGEYPEYHTSLDNFERVVSAKGLLGGFQINKKAIEAIENNFYPVSTMPCEPKLSKYNLYNPLNKNNFTHLHKFKSSLTDSLYNFLSHCDGQNSLLEISEKILIPIWETYPIIEKLKTLNLVRISFKKINKR